MESSRELFEADLHRALLAAAKAYQRNRFVVVGSAAILATHPGAPDYIRRSADIDMFPLPALTVPDMERGDHFVGQGSAFENEHDFYVERLGDWTMLTQPAGWLERCVVVSAGDVTGYCLDPLDLAYNKMEPGCHPGLDHFQVAEELSELFGRKVDLNTAAMLGRHLSRVRREGELLYGEA